MDFKAFRAVPNSHSQQGRHWALITENEAYGAVSRSAPPTTAAITCIYAMWALCRLPVGPCEGLTATRDTCHRHSQLSGLDGLLGALNGVSGGGAWRVSVPPSFFEK